MSKKNETAIMERVMKEVVKGMISLLIFFVVFMLVLVPLLREKFGISLFGEVGTDITEQIEMGDVNIKSTYLEEYGHMVMVEADVSNKSDVAMENVAIEYDLFDENDVNVGTALGNVPSIEAGAVARVQAVMKDPLDKVPTRASVKRIVLVK